MCKRQYVAEDRTPTQIKQFGVLIPNVDDVFKCWAKLHIPHLLRPPNYTAYLVHIYVDPMLDQYLQAALAPILPHRENGEALTKIHRQVQ